jgi:hypothetical protein
MRLCVSVQTVCMCVTVRVLPMQMYTGCIRELAECHRARDLQKENKKRTYLCTAFIKLNVLSLFYSAFVLPYVLTAIL